MKLKLNLINIPAETKVKDTTIRQLVNAMLAFYLHEGLFIPEIVNIELVPKVIIKKLGQDQEVRRTGDLTIVGADWRNHIIKVVYNRPESEILQSIFHEISHLIRVVNNTNKLDLVTEEVEAELEMQRTHKAVEWIVAVFAAHDDRQLLGIEELHAEKVSNSGTGGMVCSETP